LSPETRGARERGAATESTNGAHSSVGRVLERFSRVVSERAGSSAAFAVAFLTIVVWAVVGPWAGFSSTWQLVINTATTIVTFLMVFLIQRAQNKDTRAIELKLDELIASVAGASNSLIDAEDLTEEELEDLREKFRRLRARIDKHESRRAVSIEDAPEPRSKTAH
jgi:low affinity Fe/Cu permease